MKTVEKLVLTFILSLVIAYCGYAEIDKHSNAKSKGFNANQKYTAAQCARSSSREVLEINNVRTLLHNGGDMWWTVTAPEAARYEIPKQDDPSAPKQHSLYAGSIWLGGQDESTGELLVLANTYRQTNYSLWSGPLYESGPDRGTISTEECATWDVHFKISRDEVENYIDEYQAGRIQSVEDIPEPILNWPGRNNPYITSPDGLFNDRTVDMDRDLAPFDEFIQIEEEGAGDGIYDPLQGDVPFIFGDEGIWWVMNDEGNSKEFGGVIGAAPPINMEIQVMGFGFATNDVLNDMTFYWNRLLNRGSRIIVETRMGQWVDPDLGFAEDDYVGVCVPRGLGICYNGDEFDEGISGYGENPPSVGVDYFEGPWADKDTLGDGIDNDGDGFIDEPDKGYEVYEGDGIDNDKDGEVDEIDELIIMSNFVYYNNSESSINGEPDNAQDFFNYLRNKWKDGSNCTYDLGQGIQQSFPPCDFMFPGESDLEIGWGLGGNVQQPYSGPQNVAWDETVSGNQPDDRRMLQSAGPFTLEPGALNELTIGIPWARTGAGGSRGSLGKLKVADDICQKLYDNDFELLNGPDAPDVIVTELDKEIILTIEPSEFTIVNQGVRQAMNTETYKEFEANVGDFYRFEGYLFYQLANNTVTEADLDNPDKARLIAQCDIANGVTRIINYENDVTIGENIFVPVIKVEGQDNGIFRTLRVTDDAFAEGDPKLVNHKTYTFLVLSYGYNPTMAFKNLGDNVGDRKEQPFILGRRNGIRKVVVPHPSVGTILNSGYGDEFEITAESGIGNGGNILEFKTGVEEKILSGTPYKRVYRSGSGPLSIKVYDPKLVKSVNNAEVVLTSRLEYDITENNFQFLKGDTIESLGDYLSNETVNMDGNSIHYQINPYKRQTNGKAIVIREVPELESATSKTLEVRLLNGCENGTFVRDVYAIRIDGTQQTYEGSGIKRPTKFWLNSDSSSIVNAINFVEHDLWTLKADGLVVKGSVPVSDESEQTIPEFGISLELERGYNPGYKNREEGFEKNGFQDANIVYENRLQDWLIPIDYDNHPWIDQAESSLITYDQLDVYQNVLEGSWSTWISSKNAFSDESIAPGVAVREPEGWSYIQDLPNVDIVFTRDKSKWTRCMVIQMASPDSSIISKVVNRSQKSEKLSVDKNGNPDGTKVAFPSGSNENSRGYSWFPGYAIDIDKGIRLNLAFTENKLIDSVSGNDLLYNPDTNDLNNHYIILSNMPYDFEIPGVQSKFQRQMDSTFEDQKISRSNQYGVVYEQSFSWIGMMKIKRAFANLPEDDRTDVRVKLRVEKDYESNECGVPPTYTFSTSGFQSVLESKEKGQSDLDIIRVVPNPYYAYSEYEQSQVDKNVKITNLPGKCKISIFSMNGSLIRQFNRNIPEDIPGLGLSSQNWELTNEEGIPVASGVYLIHIDAGELGEKVVKFFNISRPVDLDTF
ncbi:hypothetical protein HZR84_02565 [Hyphobacterium sp. CCMP332]|nr:hypothetical protein HZR84_02565 [Hyphobacterium sp. CCMP332]